MFESGKLVFNFGRNKCKLYIRKDWDDNLVVIGQQWFVFVDGITGGYVFLYEFVFFIFFFYNEYI